MSQNYLLKIVPDENWLEIKIKDNHYLKIHFLDFDKLDMNCSDSVVSYIGLWKSTDVILNIHDSSLKETIIVKDNKSPTDFKFHIDSDLSSFIYDQKIVFCDDSRNVLYYFETPFIILSDNSIVKQPNAIKHTYNVETDVYTISIGKFDNCKYPIIIDPTIIFPSYDEHSAQKDVVGGDNTALLYITGSNANGENLGFSNITTKDDTTGLTLEKPIINGSDAVTFNSNVLAKMDFLMGTVKSPELKSISITDGTKLTNISNKSDIGFNFNAFLSPTLLYVPWASANGVDRQSTYSFVLKFSENIKQFKEYSINCDLVLNPNDVGIESSDNSYGIIYAPTVASDNLTYNIIYEPPATNISQEYVLLRVKVGLKYDVGNTTKSFARVFYSYIQFVDQTYDTYNQQFSFVKNATKNDTINGDFYAPTTNKGLFIIDTSLGITRVIDQHYGLKSTQDLDVLCAGRIGGIEKHTQETYTDDDVSDTVFGRLYKGILICTKGGAYYFENHPYQEPAKYYNPYRVSEKVFVDFVMSGNYLWLLDSNGIIYRIGHKHFLNLIYRTKRIVDSKTVVDLSDKIDIVLDTSSHQPFNSDHYIGSGSTVYNSPYEPTKDGLPTKLTPISCIPVVGNTSQDKPFNSAYEVGTYVPWNGISFLYKDSQILKKICLTILYAPVGKFKDAYNTYDILYDYLDEKDDDMIDSFPDSEKQLNKAIYTSLVDMSPNGVYEMSKIATDDKPKMNFKYDYFGASSEQYNEISMYDVGPVYGSSSRVIVGTVLPFGSDNTEALLRSQPKEGTIHFCPQNILIRDVEETGQYYNPQNGQQIDI